MKNAGLAGAIALCGIGLMMIGLGNFAKAPTAMAYTPAVAAAVQDKGEPTIVWMNSTSSVPGLDNYTVEVFHRLWSDGRMEFRKLVLRSVVDLYCDGTDVIQALNICGNNTSSPIDTGWIEIPAPPGGEGYACRSDVNGDRRVDGIDLATLLSQWGDDVSCDPQPTYPCFDLGNLNMPAVAMN